MNDIVTEVSNTDQNISDNAVANDEARSLQSLLDLDTESHSFDEVIYNDQEKTEKPKAKEQKAQDSEEEEPVTANTKALDLEVERLRVEQAHQKTKQWGHNLSRKLKSFEQKVKNFIEDGVLTEEEGLNLLEDTSHEKPSLSEEGTPLENYAKIWAQELNNIRKYTNESNIDEHILAFKHFLNNAHEDEINEAYDTFAKVKEDPIQLTRKMLEIGENYYQDIYKDLAESGGLKSFKLKYQQTINSQQKMIDKLQADIVKLKENSDYIGGKRYSLPAGSNKSFSSQDTDAPMSLDLMVSRPRMSAR